MDDSLHSIYKTLGDTAQISKWSGGIGIHIHDVRANGSYIRSTGGRSDGIIPMLKVYNDTARYVNQCFSGNTAIPTTDGIKKFKDIVIGDYVITEDGTTERVTRVFRTSLAYSELLGISTEYSTDPIWVTGEHPVLSNGKYVPVKELNISDSITTVVPKYSLDIPEYTPDDCRFYGMLLGEGSYIIDSEVSCIYMAFSSKEIEFYRNYLVNNGCKIIEDLSVKDQYRQIKFISQTGSMFKFGRTHLFNNANRKYVHKSFLHLPINKALQIIHGIIESTSLVSKFGGEFSLSVKESCIINSLKYILLRAGLMIKTEVNTMIIPNIIIKLLNNEIDLGTCRDFHGKITHFNKQIINTVYDLETEGPSHTYLTELGVVHNGGGKRSGSFAFYLEPWHADILDFLKLGLKHGDENRRARDLFYALWIPDLFMERVQNDEKWALMCPSECPGLSDVYGKEFNKLYRKYEKEGRIVKTVNAQELWHEIIKTQIETGTPYMVYKDAANHKSNQKNVGTIKSSNLCVAPETRVLTDKGYFPIIELSGKKVNVWNGKEWSNTTVKQTGINQKLLKVILSNGSIINCTEYHKFHLEDGKIVEAKDLKKGAKLINYDLPIIEEYVDFVVKNFEELYDHKKGLIQSENRKYLENTDQQQEIRQLFEAYLQN